MRFAAPFVSLLAIATAALGTLVARQSIPSCASTCLSSTNIQGCSSTNTTCLCEDTSYIDSVYACLLSSCSGSDVQTAEALAEQLCIAVGVNLTTSSIQSSSTSTHKSTSTSTPRSTSTSTSSTTSSTTSATPSHTNGASMIGGISVFTGALAVLALAAGL